MSSRTGKFAARILLIWAAWTAYAVFSASQNYLTRAYTAKDYVRLHAGREEYLYRETMSRLEAGLDPERFAGSTAP